MAKAAAVTPPNYTVLDLGPRGGDEVVQLASSGCDGVEGNTTNVVCADSTIAGVRAGVAPGGCGYIQDSHGITMVANCSLPRAVNNMGVVVGVGFPDPNSTVRHAVMWQFQNGIWEMTDLGANMGAGGIDDSGEIVGSSNTGVIIIQGQVFDLNTLVPSGSPRIDGTYAITCEGHISAGGVDPSGVAHNYLLVRQGASRNCPEQ